MEILPIPIEFEWDRGNIDKNLIKHGVNDEECEEPFLGPGRKIFQDVHHSEKEDRFLLFGKTKQQRVLVIAFTVRGARIRVISARDVNKKEKLVYEKAA